MKVNVEQAKEIVSRCFIADRVPFIVGSPGMGKSAIIHQVAAQFNLKVIDIRLSQEDPTSLLGFPQVYENAQGVKRANYAPLDSFPLEGDPLPEGYSGWLIFFDEMNAAPRALIAAAYKILLDKLVGNKKLHKNVRMAAAGNLDTDNAITESIGTAMESRLVHLEMAVSADQWIDWATKSGIDYRITSYIQAKPGNLYTFDPDHTDRTYACSRTWEIASDLIKSDPGELPPIMVPLLSGTLSEGVAREFISFCNIYTDLPTISEIVATPMEVRVPTDPSTLYAITGVISHNAKEENIGKLMTYVCRLPIEFQVVCLRETVRRNAALFSSDAVVSWVSNNQDKLF